MSVTVQASAKINLYLRVGPLRSDGYHDLATVFHAVSLHDEITVEESEHLSLEICGEQAEKVPLDGDNLAVRAAMLLARRLGREPGVRIVLRKGIPVAGGMAGGSADAAATLIACAALWHAELPHDELMTLAAQLGSDVPFCVVGGTALGHGRGERLAPVLAAGPWYWVLALADGGLSTPQVYAEFDRRRASGDGELREPGDGEPLDVPAALLSALRDGDPKRLGSLLHNDLQDAAVALRPALGRVLEAGLDGGALGGIVCGSGPTCAFLVSDQDAAVDLAARLAGSGWVRAVRCATGPAAGARILARTAG
ncbi:4-(cytidine 5'-diphospho)-2-C-methyl-D-erythritol kinase [Acidothermus cellulolyticus]|uniref:4-(cytidine 5'-diphospho)-2-C-methyl-D-erythritol kinase n=1 Tax=Acidothermus cellulolyticus TaxID=28049 RepID=UPI0002EFEB1E